MEKSICDHLNMRQNYNLFYYYYYDYYIIQYIWFLFAIPWQSLTAFSMASAERMEVRDIFKLLEKKILFSFLDFILFMNL